jgi:hypothetical protein
LLETIEALGANPLVGHSGNRGYHVHLLIAPPNGLSESFVTNSATIQLRNALWKWIVSQARINGLDLKVVDFSFVRSTEHTIRAFYSFNPRGKAWKLPIKGTHYADSIYTLTKDIAVRLLEHMIPVQRISLVEKIANGEERKYWIESVLRHPERVKDGRKRILYHLLIPYLVTSKKMGLDDAMKKLTEWLERTGADARKYQSWLKSNVRLTAKKGIKPMSYQRFVEHYPDLEKYVDWYGDRYAV